MLLYSPRWLFLIPGGLLFAVGALGLAVLARARTGWRPGARRGDAAGGRLRLSGRIPGDRVRRLHQVFAVREGCIRAPSADPRIPLRPVGDWAPGEHTDDRFGVALLAVAFGGWASRDSVPWILGPHPPGGPSLCAPALGYRPSSRASSSASSACPSRRLTAAVPRDRPSSQSRRRSDSAKDNLTGQRHVGGKRAARLDETLVSSLRLRAHPVSACSRRQIWSRVP